MVDTVQRLLNSHSVHTLADDLPEGRQVLLLTSDEGERSVLKLEKLAPEMVARAISVHEVLTGASVPGIVHIRSFGPSCEERADFYSHLDYLPGVNAEKIAEWRYEERLAVILAICAIVSDLHVHGIIHNDLKARNVICSLRDGIPMVGLVDFDLMHADAHGVPFLPGWFRATPQYASVERLIGRPTDELSDQQSLGLIACLVLLQMLPFEGLPYKKYADDRMKWEEVIANNDRLQNEPLGQVIARSLHYDPQQRYPSVQDFGGELQMLNTDK